MYKPNNKLLRELLFIIILSVILALTYNAFSDRGIPLIRREALKITIADSALFKSDSDHQIVNGDSSAPKDIKVIAPLHERALRNPDSIAKLYQDKKDPVYKIISLQQLNRLISSQKGILLDARSSEDYERGHIKGALNIPGLEAENHFEELFSIPRDTLVLIYCDNAECHLGHMLADFMSVLEFKNIYIFDGGWDEWVQAKMPIDSTITKE